MTLSVHAGYRLPLMSTMGSLVDSEYERHETSTTPTGVPVPPPPYGVLREDNRMENAMDRFPGDL